MAFVNENLRFFRPLLVKKGVLPPHPALYNPFMADVLTLSGVTIARGVTVLAAHITHALPAGGLLLLTGPNGAGKTSLLRAMAGLLDVDGTLARPASLQFLAAQPLSPSLETPRQYLTYQAALRGLPFTVADDPFGITRVLDTPLNKLSTGWRQRVKLSRLLAAHAPLWLLDEPSDGLDAGAVRTLQDVVNMHLSQGGATVIATHDPHLWPGAQALDMAVQA